MCEFNIKRIDAVNADVDKDKRGCYKRGDIINVQPDGEYAGKASHTVLAVPGLDYQKVRKLMEDRQELVTREVTITEEEFQKVKDQVEQRVVNDKTYTVAMGQYINPQLVSNVDGVRTYSVKMLETHQRRRFNIPENLMNQLFPTGVYRREVTKAQFLNHLDNLLDKTFGISIKDTNWKQTLINEIG